jgi:hypothetical protein
LFDFTPFHKGITDVMYRIREHEQVISGNIHTDIRRVKDFVSQNIVEIGIKFQSQVAQLLEQEGEAEKNELLQERVRKASAFFSDKIAVLLTDLEALEYETDNRAIKKTISEVLEKLTDKVLLKKVALNASKEGFSLTTYLSVRAKAQLAIEQSSPRPKSKVNNLKSSAHPELVLKLKAWRNAMATELDIEPYEVLRQKSMDELVALLPIDKRMLLAVKGLGAKRIREFGDELLEIILEYRQEKGITDVMELDLPPEKESTYDRTWELYSKGLSVKEIAQQRGLNPGTIETHLARFVKEGRVELTALMSPEKIEKAVSYFKKNGDFSLTPAFEALDGEISYGELRCVLSYMSRKKED